MRGTQPSPFATKATGNTAPATPVRCVNCGYTLDHCTCPKPRKHGGGHPRASAEVTEAVMKALTAGENASAAAEAAQVSRATVRRIWESEGHTWPPPGKGKGGAKGGGRPGTVTPAQAREALTLRGTRKPNGRWQRSLPAIAADLGVSPRALYRAIERLQQEAGS